MATKKEHHHEMSCKGAKKAKGMEHKKEMPKKEHHKDGKKK